VTFLEVERGVAPRGCAGPTAVADARLTLAKLQAPAGDDQLKLLGTIAPAASPPIDPAAHGLAVTLTTDDGVVLAELAAPAGGQWRTNRLDVSRRARAERPRRRQGARDQEATGHPPRPSEGARLGARRRAGRDAARRVDRLRRADRAGGPMRRDGVRGVPHLGARHVDALPLIRAVPRRASADRREHRGRRRHVGAGLARGDVDRALR
jgi:hypothetical protein